MVATSSPMDQYLAAHPDYLFGAPPEHARINPDNPFILVNHLKCARLRAAVRGGRGLRRRRGGAPGRARARGRAPPGGRASSTGRSETYPADHLSLRTVTSDNFLVIDTTARGRGAGQAPADHRRGGLEERVRHDLSEGDLHGRERAVRGAGAPLPRGRGEGRLRQARGRRLLHRRGQRQGRVDPPALEPAGDARSRSPSRARCWWRRRSSASRRSRWARSRTSARARSSCRSRRCRRPACGSRPIPGSSPRSRRAGTSCVDGLRAVTYLLHQPVRDLPDERRPRRGVLARRWLAVGGRAWW